MSYTAWRITYQDSEAAAQAAYYEAEALRKELADLKQSSKQLDINHSTVQAASCAFAKSYFNVSVKAPDPRTQSAIKAALVAAAAAS